MANDEPSLQRDGGCGGVKDDGDASFSCTSVECGEVERPKEVG